LAEIRRLAAQGGLSGEDQFRVDGTAEWFPASRLDLEAPAALDESDRQVGPLPPAPPLPPPLPPPVHSASPLRESPADAASSESLAGTSASQDKVEWSYEALRPISGLLRWLFPSPPQDPTLVEERTLTEALAATQRCLIWLVACYILALLIPRILWGLIPLQLILQIRAMRLLGWSPGRIGWTTVGGFVPYFGCLSLLIVNVNATRRLVAAGYDVGFWGARANLAASATARGPVADGDSRYVRTWNIVFIPHVRTWDIIVVVGHWLWCIVLLSLILGSVYAYLAHKLIFFSGIAWSGLALLAGKSGEAAWTKSIELKQRFSKQSRVPEATEGPPTHLTPE